MAEIQLGKLAAERAMNSEVKQFAQRMIADHTKGGDELKQSASKLNIPYPTDLDDEHQELYDRLSKLRGQEFDREYISAMADGHQDVVDELEGRARTDRQPSGPTGTTGRADDSDAISQWASKTLPTVREHLERAKQIQEKIGKS
jgi:putative membrane protein